ncbi:hypothetical protein AAZX31_11G021000 [Glycine max]|uniref:WRKY domain-containing protein n=2 Tax=Glycine subgen. Soja TaxID=1462606 RepID=K7LMM3_SOYBN|nr:WRKY transcription factor 22 [Glycine max]XP_028187490.1 WRKY transcription factor 22-like [Glycine soja]KAG4993097.1 hypothetical protein JHK86_029924 [Glycine max]KAG5123104.1 hypothetical protein JHK82_029841 [Glycine max]KAG5144518.1 hypothetical protein JHK84_030061 [Glycine max]KAH1157156.1 hypothetical protein GYH30_029779 [Glycine max]KAH1223331.1 WRKY transcription factor 22 [Glycine max]|eukprot:XP_006591525.1 WRKY transcription factor 22 [Glycine max]
MDWDLQAIVGCTKAPAATVMDNSHLMFFQHLCPEEQDDLLFNFQEFSETTTVVDELEELYKPFYPPHVHVDNNNPLPIVANSLPIPDEEVKELKPSHKAASRCKKSKKQQKNKRVVTAADGVSDPWAWRKYGQKPIKGSAYPRSYYRCSSSKGCLARKHVERSQLDPGVLIVTYTAEHSDPHPTCKNSQQRNNSSTTTIAPATPRTHDGGGYRR